MQNKIIIGAIAMFALLLLPNLSQAKWPDWGTGDYNCPKHGGVDRCDVPSGHQVCMDGTYSVWDKCVYSTDQLLAEISSSKEEYLKNPDGFRERLLQKIVDLINKRIYKTGYTLHVYGVAEYIYRMLPDVK